MFDNDLLLDLTESYLKSLIREVSDSKEQDFDSFAPFAELGIDSFFVLKIVKKLEEDFGPLPKTLLFENFNINDLAKYFVNEHRSVLFAMFDEGNANKNTSLDDGNSGNNELGKSSRHSPKSESLNSSESVQVSNPLQTTIRGLISDVEQHPFLGPIVQNIFEKFKNESSVSRGTKNIAPNIFIGSAQKGYFNYSRSNNIVLAYAYTGPEDYFLELTQELSNHCAKNNLELSILTNFEIKDIAGTPYSSTPFSVNQRVQDIKNFSLKGGKMRRLRYLISKFEKAGDCRTEEFTCGSCEDTTNDIIQIIDKWCDARTMVNPLVYIAKDEIQAGTFSKEHRIFLTYLNDILQNVIIISPMSQELNGYLMDLEFYPKDMPLGGLEFAIINIMKILVSEGQNMLSLGVTLGPKLEESDNADVRVDKILDGLRAQGIFNDEGNLQFKNKFRPLTQTIYLCRSNESDPENVLDLVMMIADPSKLQTSDVENHNLTELDGSASLSEFEQDKLPQDQMSQGIIPQDYALQNYATQAHTGLDKNSHGNQSIQQNNDAIDNQAKLSMENGTPAASLAACHYNPMRLAQEAVLFDLKTDSWAQLNFPFIDEQMRQYHSQLQLVVSTQECLSNVFPFNYFSFTESGRTSESVFCKAWESKGNVLQNILFPTAIYSLIDNGFTPIEIPSREVFNLSSSDVFKGGIDWDALVSQVEENTQDIAFVYVELSDNAAGGLPTSIKQVERLKSLLNQHSIALVLDATRILENARFVIDYDTDYSEKTIWQVCREFCSYADVVIASLAKDFGVNKGGLIATNDFALHNRIQSLINQEGNALDVIDKKLLALAFKNKNQIERRVIERMKLANSIATSLAKNNIPVVKPTGGHCVLIDVKQLKAFSQFELPTESFIAWVFHETGIRLGAHSVGMQKNSTINGLVRLAVPVGLQESEVEVVIAKLNKLFNHKVNIPELAKYDESNRAIADINEKFRLKQYHNVSTSATSFTQKPYEGSEVSIVNSSIDKSAQPDNVLKSDDAKSGKQNITNNQNTGSIQSSQANFSSTLERLETPKDIAVVGMAGRLPKAENIHQLWANLAEGLDCIEDISNERLEKRWAKQASKRYRGGFIEGLDRFDSLFFNISPREAEMLDPQERLFLEVAWETIEDAGYTPETIVDEKLPCNIGVYVGAVWAMYQMIGAESKIVGEESNPNSFLWSIANRISYFFNFSGPSLTIDTACSSSLTAIYLACDAIIKGECSSAIAGGVNLDLHQSKHDINESLGALSKDGLCKSFGTGADGYVAGEGVAAVLLKPLQEAIRAGDNIHGIIKGATINHGGRNSGYTVPNPNAQGDLIKAALEQAKIDARTIGYVETHGTGTELGDPIEVSGLSKAFNQYGVTNQTCSIGSIKSNIGHLEAAAGIVGLFKVLLQMRYRKLVPSLHSTTLNEHIDFEKSPFFVQQDLIEWKPKTIDGVTFPLRAGVSSFGAGGANAHLVVEEYISADRPNQKILDERESSHGGETVFPLSAKTEVQLLEYARRLKAHIEEQEICANNPSLFNDISYTLQVGRKSFEHRAAVVASTIDELSTRLEKLLDKVSDTNIILGHVKNSEGVTKLLNKKEKQKFVEMLSHSRDIRKLAQLWVEGLLNDWSGFKHRKAVKTSLPTYPFADKRHWIAKQSDTSKIVSHSTKSLHPLIDSNQSTFEKQVFKKNFNEKEFFIYDHLVSDIQTLPGVAYLDLARKSGELAIGQKVQKIQNILWVSPLTVESNKVTETFIDLKPNGETVNFEVFSEGREGKKQLYSQGRIVYASDEELNAEPEFIDIGSIKSRVEKVIDGKQAYPLFKSLGLNLGPSFQVLQNVYNNEHEVLGELKLPDIADSKIEDFVLHPSLIDGSLQAAMAAKIGQVQDEMFVPYSIGEVEILAPLEHECFTYVKEIEDPNSKVSKANVFVLNREGKILVKIKESIGVPLTDVHEKPSDKVSELEFSELYYSFTWEEAPLPSVENIDAGRNVLIFSDNKELSKLCLQQLEMLGKSNKKLVIASRGEAFKKQDEGHFLINPQSVEDYNSLFSSLNASGWELESLCFDGDIDNGDNNNNPDKQLNDGLETGVYSLLSLSQSLAEQKLTNKISLNYFFSHREDTYQPQQEAIAGFCKTLEIENSKVITKIIEFESEKNDLNHLAQNIILESNINPIPSTVIRYKESLRYLRNIEEIEVEASDSHRKSPSITIKQQGTYLITGGAGGLGFIFAEHLAQVHKSKLILVGRSSKSKKIEDKLSRIKELGGEAIYLNCDISNNSEVRNLIKQSTEKFGDLNGILHSAGVLRDSYIKNKTKSEMEAVFGPKVYGTQFLDEATKQLKLDFFVTFSSMAAVGGNAGQCDYSYANHFMDSFIKQREKLQKSGKRYGKSLSINWSLWADGGMKLDEQTELFFKKNLGIHPLRTDTGLKAFEAGLNSSQTQFIIVEGDKQKIEKAWGLGESHEVETSDQQAAGETDQQDEATSDLVLMVQDELAQMVMDFLKLDPEDMDLDKILLDLGFDSIGLTTYANLINEKYGLDVTPVLFFEYPSIKEIAKHLAVEQRELVNKFHFGGLVEPQNNLPAKDSATQKQSVQSQGKLLLDKGWKSPGSSSDEQITGPHSVKFSPENRFKEQPIAVVGMHGVMPESDDLNEFWNNLENAKNMISVIPEERWAWEDYHGDPLKEENKTNSKWGGFMKEVDKFDPLFFGISPREAIMMDPQQRIFLETVWKAVEDSGQKVSDLAGTKTGLFVGVATNDYSDLITRQNIGIDAYTSTGNTHSVLVNRVSFLLDITGPSAPFDTACSSSLVALHRAVESIHTGSSDMAIAGGVQVMVSPSVYISFGIAGMLSNDGKCKTFDKQANGYVRGEGSGAIFIKPLTKAEEDGNHIYALIKATSENHGGRVTTLTAPNPSAQTDLLLDAYEKAEIDPSSIGYIECHGTGTALGDPIEIQALQKAFSELYKKYNKTPDDVPHCGLGSVKTNIGHLETAAGIAGIFKVLLAIKHKKIPASINFEELNPYIKLEGSPFYIVDKTVPWNSTKNEKGESLPRRSGVSSFGFGGANSHIVFEEYLPANLKQDNQEESSVLIVLSAKNEERLKDYAELLLEHLNTQEDALLDVAYTLQVGRDEMRDRLAVIVASKDELKQKLTEFLDNESKIDGLYRGNTLKAKDKGKKSSLKLVGAVEVEMLEQLAHEWVSGKIINWVELYSNKSVSRISLPTYPFARDRYWISKPGVKQVHSNSSKLVGLPNISRIHALIHQNASTLKEQKFVTQFSGEEFYFADHIVQTQKILPGVAYMEMARVAGELAAEAPVRVIRNLKWERPIVFTKDMRAVETSVNTNHQGVMFEVKTPTKEKPIIHCSGELNFSYQQPVPNKLDIDGIRQRCSDEVISAEELYPYLNAQGLKLGKSFQIVQNICATKQEALSTLKLPDNLVAGAEDFWIHPALMDGSLHTAMGLLKKVGMELPLSLPVSVGEVVILNSLKDLHYGYATWAVDEIKEDVNLLKANFHLLDKNGKVLVIMKDFVSRPFFQPAMQTSNQSLSAGTFNADSDQTYFESVWKESTNKPIEIDSNRKENFLVFDQTELVSASLKEYLNLNGSSSSQVVLVGMADKYKRISDEVYQINPEDPIDYIKLIESLVEREIPIQNILHLWSEVDFSTKQNELKKSLNRGVVSLLNLSKALMESQKKLDELNKKLEPEVTRLSKVKILYVFANDKQDPQSHHSAMISFGKCLTLENSRYNFKSIELFDNDFTRTLNSKEIIESALSELQSETSDDVEVRYIGNSRYTREITEVEMPHVTNFPLKENGCYLITGGLGGLGLIFARYLAKQAQVKLVLTGRSNLSDSHTKCIKELESIGAEVLYVRTDVSKLSDVNLLIEAAKKKFNTINGIIHSAGILKDSLIANKTLDEMDSVFSAKIFGTVNLDQATQEEDLDFFCLFSSMTSITGNAGQTDYAYANSFMDNFAERRNLLKALQKRKGNSLSINWPLWKDGGMGITQQMEAFLKDMMGMHTLGTEIGLDSFVKGISSEKSQFMVMQGDLNKIRRMLGVAEVVLPQQQLSQQRLAPQQNPISKSVAIEKTQTNLAKPRDIPSNENQINQTGSKQIGKLVKKDLLRMIAETLMIDEQQLSPDVDMSEYGLDSIGLGKLFGEMNSRYELDLTPAIFFEYPTLNTLSEYLGETFQDQLSEYFSDDLIEAQGLTTESGTNGDNGADCAIENEPSIQLLSSTGIMGEAEPSVLDFRNSNNLTTSSPIAIVGLSCVMPQSENAQEFWLNLEAEKDLISEIPPDRWDWRDYDGNPLEERNKTNSKWGGFMQDVDKFDPFFFGISPMEAELMDPQQRIFLETVWNTIEDSGHKASDLAGSKTGLFVGVGGRDYLDLMRDSNVDALAYASTGNTHSILTNRISFFLDLHGPSEPIETACSSSLVAVHRAVEAIQSGSCDMAIAGGVNVLLSPGLYLAFGNAGMLASDGRCKTFDKSANGYVRGEGSGAIFLKTQRQAIKDGNHIYGIVKGTGVNHGGHATSLTAPNPNAQAELLVDVYSKANVDPNTISFIEAHGTGTPLGDPVEINALKKAFLEINMRRGKGELKESFCGIGSVKTNIGHLETAAGIAGVIKVLLAMKHKKMPGNIHFKELNPHIRLEQSPFYIHGKTQTWEPIRGEDDRELPRRAGVSSFSFGGANAHIILEEFIPSVNVERSHISDEKKSEFIFPLSAKSMEQLHQKATELRDYLVAKDSTLDSVELDSLAYTLQVGREAMEERVSFLATSQRQLVERVEQFVKDPKTANGICVGSIKEDKESISLISNNEDIKQALVEKLMSSNKLSSLADMWVKGLDIDWNKLYGDFKPNRVSIPTYPFLKDRYWFDNSQTNTAGNVIQRTSTLVDSKAKQSIKRFQELRTLVSSDLTRFLEEAE